MQEWKKTLFHVIHTPAASQAGLNAIRLQKEDGFC